MDTWLALGLHWLVSGAVLALVSFIVPGFSIRGFRTCLLAMLLIGTANIFIKPILMALTIPFTVLTLGAFVFVVDAIILRLCAALMDDFEITNWISAIIGAFVLAAASSFFHMLLI